MKLEKIPMNQRDQLPKNIFEIKVNLKGFKGGEAGFFIIKESNEQKVIKIINDLNEIKSIEDVNEYGQLDCFDNYSDNWIFDDGWGDPCRLSWFDVYYYDENLIKYQVKEVK